MFIVYGLQKQRIDPHSWASELSVQEITKAHAKAFQAVFLQFSPNLFYPLHTDAEIEMASRLVFLYHTQDYDSDGWIAETKQMEEYYDAQDEQPPDSPTDSEQNCDTSKKS